MEELIGRSLGRDNQYTLVSLIGRGGMSAVFKAQQSKLQRNVAVKILDPVLTRDNHFIQRFTNEARVVANLEHWNILPVYDFGQEGDLFYLVMRLVEGGTLKERFAEGQNQPWTPRQVLPLISQVLSAMDYAHSRDIIHRDVKPHNILLEGNHPFLADFGLAKLLEQGAELTQAGLLLGTPAYMSPEQVLGKDLDARSDLYSCAVVLYQLLTGRVPFRAETPNSAFQHVHSPMPRPREINPQLAPELEAVLLKALSRDRNQRFDSGAAFAEALTQATVASEQSAAGGEGNATEIQAAPAKPYIWSTRRAASRAPANTTRPGPDAAKPSKSDARRRRRWPLLVAAAVLLLAVAGGAIYQNGWPFRAGWGLPGTASASAGAPPAETSVAREEQTVPAASGAADNNEPSQSPAASATDAGGRQESPPAEASVAASTDAAATSPGGTQLAPPEGTLVYNDDFGSGLQTSGLYGEVTKTGFSSGIHDPGVFHFKLPEPDAVNVTALPRFAARDFTLELDVWDNSDEFSGGIALGSIFRMRSADQYYAWLIDPRTQQYAVRKLNGAQQWTELIPWQESLLIKRRKEVNHLRIDGRGDTFTLYLNGELLDRFTDGEFELGMLGMIAVNIDANQPHMHFDNINVWSTDAEGAAAEPLLRDDPAGAMVQIPGGEFIMGSNEVSDDQPHIVDLPEFYIDRSEVTNALYRRCVEAGGCTPQLVAASETHPSYANQAQFDSYPALQVTWTQAQAFCSWAGKRLPSEAEWEKAASWNSSTRQKTVWPWGNTFDASRLNSDESGNRDTTAEDAYPPELNGTLAMAGNVAEWTSSVFSRFPYDATDGREDADTQGDRVFRGGSWAQTWGKARAFVRQQAAPTYAGREIGFRCAANP